MKKIVLFGAAICCMFTLGSCKSKTSAYQSAYEQAKANDNYWEEEVVVDDSEVLTNEVITNETVVPERVTVIQGEDLSGLKKYSVVIGVFSVRTNAYSLKENMTREGFRPIIAENSAGQLRVIAASYDIRSDAIRARDVIKTKYAPNFKDAWILERQY